MLFAQRAALQTNNVQDGFFRRAAGTRRFAYNWARAKQQELYKARKAILEHNAQETEKVKHYRAEGKEYTPDLKEVPPYPSESYMRKLMNSIKGKDFPWMYDIPRAVVAQAIKDYGKALDRFFNKTSGYPKKKKKGKGRDSFYLDNGDVKFITEGKRSYIQIPKIGRIRMCEPLRFKGKVMSVTISRTADRWFASIVVDTTPVPPYKIETQEIVGMDIGAGKDAVLSTGEAFIGPKPFRRLLDKLRRLQRDMSRKKFGSKNYKKATMKVARLHARIANMRKDFIHKMTTDLVGRFGTIVVENLNVKGMVKNWRLAKTILDTAFYEIKRQLIYKAKAYGTRIVEVDRWFPSSKLCSHCWSKHGEMPLSVRAWTCETCGTAHDRDTNAAINLRKAVEYADSSAVFACGEESSTVVSIDGRNFSLKNLAIG